MVLQHGGIRDAAQSYLEPAIEILERVSGSDDPAVARARVNLANLQLERDDVAGARRSAERALATLEAALGPKHPSLNTALSVLGHIERQEGNLAQAEAYHRRELEIAENPAGGDPVSADLARVDLARVLFERDRPAEAIALIEPALARLTETLGEAHPHVAAAKAVRSEGLASAVGSESGDQGEGASLHRSGRSSGDGTENPLRP